MIIHCDPLGGSRGKRYGRDIYHGRPEEAAAGDTAQDDAAAADCPAGHFGSSERASERGEDL